MKYVFLIGCPRSGTTWLQMLLSQHPAIATSQETHLFSSYIEPLRQRWDYDRTTPRDIGRGIGIQAAITSEQFDTLCADFARSVLDQIAAGDAKARVVLEKTPAHVRHLPLLIKLVPNAYIIHLVRDPRSVAVSLTAAGRGWGRRWAANNYADNARRWVADVGLGLDAVEFTDNVRQVCYEDLAGDSGEAVLDGLIRWLDLDLESDFSRRALAACRIDRLRDKTSSVQANLVIADDPAGFYGEGKTRGWREKLSARELHLIEYIAGDTMQALGYAVESGSIGKRKPAGLIWQDAVDGVEWRARHWLSRAFAGLKRLAF